LRISTDLKKVLEQQIDIRGERKFVLGFNGELALEEFREDAYALRSHYHATSPPKLRDSLQRRGAGTIRKLGVKGGGRAKIRHAGEGRLKLQTVSDTPGSSGSSRSKSAASEPSGTVFTCYNPNTGPNRPPKKLVALRKWADLPGW
jgi:hypothetical protein